MDPRVSEIPKNNSREEGEVRERAESFVINKSSQIKDVGECRKGLSCCSLMCKLVSDVSGWAGMSLY